MTINRDGAAGALFLLAGLFVVWQAQNHPMGTLLRMGPGYYPTLIGGMMAIVGLVLICKAALAGGVAMPRLAWSKLCLLIGAIIVMAFTLDRLGLIVSTFLLVTISRLASKPFNPAGTLVLAAALSAVGAGIFWWFLSIPIPLWP